MGTRLHQLKLPGLVHVGALERVKNILYEDLNSWEGAPPSGYRFMSQSKLVVTGTLVEDSKYLRKLVQEVKSGTKTTAGTKGQVTAGTKLDQRAGSIEPV